MLGDDGDVGIDCKVDHESMKPRCGVFPAATVNEYISSSGVGPDNGSLPIVLFRAPHNDATFELRTDQITHADEELGVTPRLSNEGIVRHQLLVLHQA